MEIVFNQIMRSVTKMKYCLAIFLLLTNLTAHAALHKWVDSEGKVHYSDTAAPPAVKSQKLRETTPAQSISSSNAAAPAPKTEAEREADRKRAQKEKGEAEQKAAQQQEEAANKQKNCESARSNLVTLERSPRLVTYDAQGEPTYLDDNARQQRIAEANKAISNYCN